MERFQKGIKRRSHPRSRGAATIGESKDNKAMQGSRRIFDSTGSRVPTKAVRFLAIPVLQSRPRPLLSNGRPVWRGDLGALQVNRDREGENPDLLEAASLLVASLDNGVAGGFVLPRKDTIQRVSAG